ncbi:hypothetical protein [Lysinibacillus irui]|uniref:hypothetical protein n=1 Tax=Lysinibacillus irui TaxID=2998077 RepID=UPI002AD39F5F|nr:hypothetical protein [Lysinibacillus irui]MEA0563463.1 hypothetical protein [Lysinibacillus irui]
MKLEVAYRVMGESPVDRHAVVEVDDNTDIDTAEGSKHVKQKISEQTGIPVEDIRYI